MLAAPAAAPAAAPSKRARLDDMAAPAAAPARSWVDVPAGCDWSIHNIPFGVFSPPGDARPRVGTAIGAFALDLALLAARGLLGAEYAAALQEVRVGGGAGAPARGAGRWAGRGAGWARAAAAAARGRSCSGWDGWLDVA